jgi:hypothetical protein
MPSRPAQREELDSPWKEALEHFLEWFLALCFPQVHAGIDLEEERRMPYVTSVERLARE